eukprot:9290310-Lingulodinium_polyedra.AAC.1
MAAVEKQAGIACERVQDLVERVGKFEGGSPPSTAASSDGAWFSFVEVCHAASAKRRRVEAPPP